MNTPSPDNAERRLAALVKDMSQAQLEEHLLGAALQETLKELLKGLYDDRRMQCLYMHICAYHDGFCHAKGWTPSSKFPIAVKRIIQSAAPGTSAEGQLENN